MRGLMAEVVAWPGRVLDEVKSLSEPEAWQVILFALTALAVGMLVVVAVDA